MSPCGIGRVQSDSEGGLRLGFKPKTFFILYVSCLLWILTYIIIILFYLVNLLIMKNEKTSFV